MRALLWAAFVLLAPLAFGQGFKPGEKVKDFNLADLEGKTVSYASLKGSTTVVVFIATKCPVSNAYNDRMKAVYQDYSSRGVRFLFVNANASEPAAEVAAHAQQHGFAFPVYKDPGNATADLFGAEVTPEAFVIDSHDVVRYHGYIDDSRAPERIQNQGLRHALDATLAGQAVEKAETKAFGCTIKRGAKRAS
jgi:peroxiredoxin